MLRKFRKDDLETVLIFYAYAAYMEKRKIQDRFFLISQAGNISHHSAYGTNL